MLILFRNLNNRFFRTDWIFYYNPSLPNSLTSAADLMHFMYSILMLLRSFLFSIVRFIFLLISFSTETRNQNKNEKNSLFCLENTCVDAFMALKPVFFIWLFFSIRMQVFCLNIFVLWRFHSGFELNLTEFCFEDVCQFKRHYWLPFSNKFKNFLEDVKNKWINDNNNCSKTNLVS